MARPENEPESQKMFTLALVVVAVLALYFAADVLMPLALAVLLTFILAPLVTRLERWHMGRVPAVLVAVGASFALLFSIGWIVANQMIDLASEANTYRDNIISRIQYFKRTETGPLSRLERTIKQFNSEITQPVRKQIEDATGKPEKDVEDGATADDSMAKGPPSQDNKENSDSSTKDNSSEDPKPVPVEIVQPSFSPYAILTGVLPGAFGWLATAGIVIVFVIFMLLEREDMRNRVIRLIGPDQITATTRALDDAGHRVGKYLRMQLIINASYGVMIALGLYLIGLPNALTWGLLAGMLRYLPYVGPWMGASIGILLSLAVFDTWTEPLLTLSLFLVAELIVNNVLEPVLYHSSTGISTVGILVAALFWTWLWGPVGLVLATPLTVCIVVIGRYVPTLQFLNVLLSDETGLPPGAHLYQRLLVSDEEESRELVEDYLKGHTVDELFEHVLVPALVLTEQDAHRGALEEKRRQYILENLNDLLDELAELNPAKTTTDVEPRPANTRAILIVPARDLADEVAGQMLQFRLEERGIDASLLSHKLMFSEIVEQISSSPSPIVVISAVPPFAVRHARNLTKRLQARMEGLKILVGLWNPEEHGRRTDQRLTSAGCERVFNRMETAIENVERFVPSRRPQEAPAETAAD